ncbi:MAG: hypothetical protein EXR72_09330 [Myxococcales bacterium]|nr:hypothetical protein [Myxococcales bacterium]
MGSLGLTGTTPQDPVALSRFAGSTVKALGEKKLPPSRVEGATFHAAKWAARIGGEQAQVEAALADVAREAREAEGTLTQKNSAISAYDDRFTRGASFLSGLFGLAGERELAARVRPSTRRPGQTADDEPTEPGPSGPE